MEKLLDKQTQRLRKELGVNFNPSLFLTCLFCSLTYIHVENPHAIGKLSNIAKFKCILRRMKSLMHAHVYKSTCGGLYWLSEELLTVFKNVSKVGLGGPPYVLFFTNERIIAASMGSGFISSFMLGGLVGVALWERRVKKSTERYVAEKELDLNKIISDDPKNLVFPYAEIESVTLTKPKKLSDTPLKIVMNEETVRFRLHECRGKDYNLLKEVLKRALKDKLKMKEGFWRIA